MIEQRFGGIDVSQDRLDVLLLPQGTGFSVANDEAGWSTLIGRNHLVRTREKRGRDRQGFPCAECQGTGRVLVSVKSASSGRCERALPNSYLLTSWLCRRLQRLGNYSCVLPRILLSESLC